METRGPDERLLAQGRFSPCVTVQALGAFNDNIYRQAILGPVFFDDRVVDDGKVKRRKTYSHAAHLRHPR